MNEVSGILFPGVMAAEKQTEETKLRSVVGLDDRSGAR